MSTHEQDKNMKPDEDFLEGKLSFLVKGNKCRFLDGRRTTGYIESFDDESAMFRWRITKYEDKGKHWDMPAEHIKSFQFEKDSKILSSEVVEYISQSTIKFKEKLNIEPNQEISDSTEKRIEEVKKDIIEWLKTNSDFIKKNMNLDTSSKIGSVLLAKDLKEYMRSIKLDEIEKITTDAMVLNPNSGEWIKGMSITLAELGLTGYNGRIPRTKNIFDGKGSKKNREKYLIHRIAFVRAYFALMKIDEVILYRGMSTESDLEKFKRTYLQCTFSLDVAKDFSDLEKDSKYKNSYILKMTCPVEKLFMTYYETEAMNRQYKEAEAIIFYDESISL